MIGGGVDIQQRHRDIAQIHQTITYLQLTLDEFIVLIAIFNELAHTFTGLSWTVKYPLFHSEEIEQFVLVFHDIQHIHIFADIQIERHQH